MTERSNTEEPQVPELSMEAERIAELEKALLEAQHEARINLQMVRENATTIKAMSDSLAKAQEESEFQREVATALKLQIERAKGWIDRVLEGEETYDAPKERTVPIMPVRRGPDLQGISMPHRRSKNNDGFFDLQPGTISGLGAAEPLRRY